MLFFARLKDTVSKPSIQQVLAFIDEPDAQVFVPDDSYLRLVLTDLSLSQSMKWFTDRYPSVTARVSLDFGGTPHAFTTVAGPPAQQLGPGVYTNYPLTPLLPYRGGVVEISAGLIALMGDDHLRTVISVLGGFSALVGPPLTAAVRVATELGNGIDKLVQGGADIVLGLHDSYVAPSDHPVGNVLRGGHIAVVRADSTKFDKRQLMVVRGRLAYAGRPLNGYDYVVFHIECRQDRDSWSFPDLETLLNETKRRMVTGDDTGAEAVRKQLFATIVTSSDLTEADRWRVADKVKAELERIKTGALGAVAAAGPSLEQALRTSRMDLDQARALPPISLADFA